jgi:TonB family protein
VRTSDNDFLLLALGGTVAVHLVLITAIDILNVTVEIDPPEVAPHVELVEIELPKLPEPPPPPPPPKARVNEEVQQRTETKVVRTRTPVARTQQVTKVDTPKTETETETKPDSGGHTVQLDEGLLPTGKIPVAVGKRQGTGGTGSGAGAGSGNGSGDAPPAPPPPVSVATIKKLAMPKGDHGYIDAGRDYPAAARQSGIEGVIQVKLVVDATGKVRSAVLLNKLGYGLDELALQKAKLIEFEPARDTDDKPVTSVLVWKFNMVLPKK